MTCRMFSSEPPLADDCRCISFETAVTIKALRDLSSDCKYCAAFAFIGLPKSNRTLIRYLLICSSLRLSLHLRLGQIFISLCGGADVLDEFHTVGAELIKVLHKAAAATSHIQGHRVFVIAVLAQPAEDVPHILGGDALYDFQISRRNICRAGDQHLVDDGIVDLPLRFLHKRLTNGKGILVSPEFLGEHFALLRLAVDHIQRVYRAVADVGDQVHAFQCGGKARNGGVPLRIGTHIVDIEVVVCLFVGELHLGIFYQICLEVRLLPACPDQGQTGGNRNVRLGEIFGFQFLGDGRRGQHIIVLVLDFVRCKLLVSLADEVIPAAVDQHIRCE